MGEIKKTIKKKKKNSEFWKRFNRNTPAVGSLCVFLVVLFISLFANLITNDKPLVLFYKGDLFFPAVVDYLPAKLGEEGFVVDYFSMHDKIDQHGWALWPPIKQKPFEQNLNFESLPAPPGSSSIISITDDYNGYEVSHIIGTDTGGRDLLTRLIYGCRTSLVMATIITLISLFLGMFLGSLMGYRGGTFDLVVGRVLETVGYFPVIFLMIILVAFIESPSNAYIVGIFSVLGLSPFAFYMRGQVLKVRKMTYIEAAHAIGQKDFKIMLRHVLPNSFSPILVLVPFTITGNITALATIDFLGFGVQPPTSSLGLILRSGYDDLTNRWWLIASSSVVLVLILLLVNFIGEGVRDGLDPRANITKKIIHDLEEKEKANTVSLA